MIGNFNKIIYSLSLLILLASTLIYCEEVKNPQYIDDPTHLENMAENLNNISLHT